MRPRSSSPSVVRLAALAVSVVVAAAACGGSSSLEPSSGSSPEAASSPAASAPAVPSSTASGSDGAAPSASSEALASTAPLDCSALVKTPEQTEGPYYKAGSPERSDLREPGMPGTTLVVSGYVVTADCTPVAGAVIDVWQADSTGTYDNAGYTLRGHLSSGADGSYSFTTVVPGIYPGRTEHIHVKVTPPEGATLTTQLYFPGVDQNEADGIFDPATLLAITETADGLAGTYDFVL